MATAKKYIDFTAGTFDPLQVLLQANPSTGELSKILLSSILPFKLLVGNLFTNPTGIASFYVPFNNLGSAITPSRTSAGVFSLDAAASIFVNNETMILTGQPNTHDVHWFWYFDSDTTMQLASFDNANDPVDGYNIITFLIINPY